MLRKASCFARDWLPWRGRRVPDNSLELVYTDISGEVAPAVCLPPATHKERQVKAASFTQTGPPEVIQWGDLPTPEPKSHEILIRVKAVSVNPIDTYIRAGVIPAALPMPYIVGCDFAGTVEAVGGSVGNCRVGQRVWGSNQGLFGRQGSFAELICVDTRWCYETPKNQTDTEAAAGALVGITAHLGLFHHGGLRQGEVVFVNGGTGGVGSAVVQLAKSAGAFVVTTAGSEEKLAHAKELGADVALNYKSANLDDELRAALESRNLEGVDLWFETQREPTLERTISLMRKRGRIIVMAGRDAQPSFPLGAFYTNDLRIIGFAMFNASPEEQRAAAMQLNQSYEAGGWKPQIGKVLPLSEAAAAHRLQEENTLQGAGNLSGKIVLTA